MIEFKQEWFRGGITTVIIQMRGQEKLDTHNCFLIIDNICKRIWKTYLESTKRDYRVIRFDFQGGGRISEHNGSSPLAYEKVKFVMSYLRS